MARSQKHLLDEVDVALTRTGKGKGKRKAKVVKRHRAVRESCAKCGEPHSTSEHASHGVGSFARTHGDAAYRTGRSAHMEGGEDVLLLMDLK